MPGASPVDVPAPASPACVPGLATDQRSARTRQLLSDYAELTKPKVQSLLLLTTIATMYVAGNPSPLLVVLTCIGGYLSAGGAGAVNHFLDRDIDALMARTASRPIPAGRISPRAALTFGCLLAALSLLELSLAVNPLAAGLSFAGFLGYVFVYTIWLKRRTPQNIVIGGAAGAVPPLVGWAAVSGSVSGTAVILFFIVFFWTPAHFWSLSLLAQRDYARAGVPMLPADPAVRGPAVRRHAAALLRRPLRRHLPGGLAGARADLRRGRRAPVPSRRPPRGAAAVPVLTGLPRAAVLRDGGRRAPVAARQRVSSRRC